MMKYIILALLLSTPVDSKEFDVKTFLDKAYIKVGVGYKIAELDLYFTNKNGRNEYFNEPLAARLEIGYRISNNVTIGYTHRSQFLRGAPEYYVDELFIDYKINLGDLF